MFFCNIPRSPEISLTHPCNKLLEVNERIPVLIQKPEQASCQHRCMCTTGPGCQTDEQLFELLHVYAILLQVGQTLISAGSCSTIVSPVATHQILCLWRERVDRSDYYNNPWEWRLSYSSKIAPSKQRRDMSDTLFISTIITSIISLQNSMM